MGQNKDVIGDGDWTQTNKNAWAAGTQGERRQEERRQGDDAAPDEERRESERRSGGGPGVFMGFTLSMIISTILVGSLIAILYFTVSDNSGFHRTFNEWTTRASGGEATDSSP